MSILDVRVVVMLSSATVLGLASCFDPEPKQKADTEGETAEDETSNASSASDGAGSATSIPETCGNDALDPSEECDDGNAADDDECLSNCRRARCGDGQVRTGFEDCDDGNLESSDRCTANCDWAICGDGYVYAEMEDCDDGNTVDGDACPRNCKFDVIETTVADDDTTTGEDETTTTSPVTDTTTSTSGGSQEDSTAGPTGEDTVGSVSNGDSGEGDPTAGGNRGDRYVSGGWSGCAWTATDSDEVGSTISPTDFSSRPAGGDFCVSGSVGPSDYYSGFAALGFNLADPPNEDCSNVTLPWDATSPNASLPQEAGVAVRYTRTAPNAGFRINLYGVGPEGDVVYWCAELPEAGGATFIPYTEFSTQCWAGGTGYAYAGEAIASVVFVVAGGADDPVAYDFCIEGFADGNSASDAP